MLIVKYSGGLGNQMYQYALQVVLQKKYPDQKIKADISHYHLMHEHNGFELPGCFGMEFDYASKKEVKKIYNGFVPGAGCRYLPFCVKKFLAQYYSRFYRKIRNMVFKRRAMHSVTDGIDFDYCEKIDHLEEGDWYIHGTWQNRAYFDAYRTDMIAAFPLEQGLSDPDLCVMRDLKDGNAIAVHVRGGDFLNRNWDLCDREYYLRAFEKMDRDLPVYVFTDDRAYAVELLKGFRIKHVISHDVDESLKDMYMLSKARYIILSNSTFAFWGAYLNEDPDKRVVCPLYSQLYGKDYFPYISGTDWECIDNSI